MRSIVIPDRFRRIVKGSEGLFIPALAQYAEEVVADAWRGSFAPLLDLPGVIRRVEQGGHGLRDLPAQGRRVDSPAGDAVSAR